MLYPYAACLEFMMGTSMTHAEKPQQQKNGMLFSSHAAAHYRLFRPNFRSLF